uniref:Uncharacterized protein n=1 Tax=Scleropages formosus TaxID=113540 RepID=A0A8C9V3Y3_SCLFO
YNRKLKLKHNWLTQYNNDPKRKNKSTSEWVKRGNSNVLERLNRNPKPNNKDQFVLKKSTSVAEIQQFWKEEWANNCSHRCKGLFTSMLSYWKGLAAVIAAKGNHSTEYYLRCCVGIVR